MKKVKITADGIFGIIKSIFTHNDIDILDDDSKQNFDAKTVQDALNIEYHTFKYRPASTEQIIAEAKASGQPVNVLAGVDRSFCCFTLGSVERVFTKDIDQIVIDGILDFWVQTSKLPIIDFLIDKVNRYLSGIRVPIEFQPENEIRKASIIFETPSEPDYDIDSQIGESARVSVSVLIVLSPDVVSYSDYEVSFEYIDNGEAKKTPVPLSSFSYVSTMTQKAVPVVERPQNVGSINLSKAISFVLVFDGYNNDFINYTTNRTLSAIANDNNTSQLMTVTRGEKEYSHEVIVKDHQVTVNSDTGNETHTLSLVTRGL